MSLPMMQSPYYSVEVPSTGKKVNFRPFLVREEKALLLAQQSEDSAKNLVRYYRNALILLILLNPLLQKFPLLLHYRNVFQSF